jgi:hypothetical protein
MIDWTITAGNVLTVVGMAVVALAAFFSLRGRLDLTQSKAREAFDIAKMARDELQPVPDRCDQALHPLGCAREA